MEFRFVILGAANIASKFCKAVKLVPDCEVAAVASKSLEKAQRFAEAQDILGAYGDYEEMLEKEKPDGAYIAVTPNDHFRLTMLCLEHGIPVLCEKAMFQNSQEAETVFRKSEETGLFVMEAMWSRFLPAVKKVREWVAEERIGKPEISRCAIGFVASKDENSRYRNPALGGGAAKDITVYAYELTRYIIQQKIRHTDVSTKWSRAGVDLTDHISIVFTDTLAEVLTSFSVPMDDCMTIYGEKGRIVLPRPHVASECFLYGADGTLAEHFVDEETKNGFEYEIQEMIQCVRAGKIESTVVPHETTLDCARLFDEIAASKETERGISAKGQGAFETGVYRNVFLENGYSQESIDCKIEEAFSTMFYGPEEERIYHPVGDDMGYMEDTGNHDARTEGMSYGMMMCVQMDKKEEFDRLWKWAKTYMYMEEGIHAGYFAWSCQTDGTKNAYGPAPDGEEFFAMALFFAAHRWGNGEGIFNYEAEAKKLLHACVHNGDVPGKGYSMWDAKNHLIKFIPECDYTDPSYHLPHFYELFALWAEEEDRPFWKEAARASREYLKKACHSVTGLSPEYAEYDGTPRLETREGHPRRDIYYSDSYRTIANIGLDYEWFRKEEEEPEIAEKLQRFFCETQEGQTDGVYELDGTALNRRALHPTAITATNAQASLAAGGENARVCVRKFWETPLRKGDRRYYDNCLYFFALLALSGNYRIWK